LLGVVLAVLMPAHPRGQSIEWPQWGGPGRSFRLPAAPPAAAWPASGPKELWSRALGEGHSSIAVDRGRLYTQVRPLGLLAAVRRSQDEVVTALDAATGKTIWEHGFWSPDGLLFVSVAYNTGSRVLRLSPASGKTNVEELWFSNRMRVHIGTVVRIGDMIVGSSVAGRNMRLCSVFCRCRVVKVSRRPPGRQRRQAGCSNHRVGRRRTAAEGSLRRMFVSTLRPASNGSRRDQGEAPAWPRRRHRNRHTR
jgi:hypothetical protein